MGLTVASHFMDGATYHGPVALDERLNIHIFQKGDQSVGFLWAAAGQDVTLTAVKGLTFYDLMGNRIEDHTVQATDSPLYFTIEGDIGFGREILSGLKVDS